MCSITLGRSRIGHYKKQKLRSEKEFPVNVTAIQWNPCVPQIKLRRLYASDARGLLDEDLLEDVGLSLYLRCQSIVIATEALCGRAACAQCGTVIQHRCVKHARLQCPTCGWAIAWYKYRRAAEGLRAGGAMPAYRAFLAAYEHARTARDKLLLIDRLIHAFHWETKQGPTRPAGTSLIEGSLEEVVRFLDQLSAGPDSTPSIGETKARWQQQLAQAGRDYPWIQRLIETKTTAEIDPQST
jgi:hypothetical protein